MKFATRITAIAIVAGLGGLACDQVTEVTDGENTAPTAVAGSDRQVDLGSTVTLDGSGSSDPDGDVLTYSWELASVPSGSNATVNDPSNASTTFVPDSTGDYTAVLQVSDGTDTDADTVVITAQLNTELSGTISRDTTLEDVGQDYHVTGNLSVGAALVVEPGVTIRFDADDRLIIDTGGSLKAVGTSTDSIRFLGDQEAAGYWDGIEVRTVDPSNELAYVEVAHGGSGGWANVYVTASGRIAVHDSRIHSSSGYGVEVESGGSIEGFANNTLRDNGSGAVLLDADEVGELDAGSSYGDASADRVVIAGGTALTTQTWSATDVPYRLASNTYIESAVTVQPGAVFRATQYERLIVQSGGSLKAVGTSTDSIRFLGEQASADYWDGIEILTTSADNQFSYVEVAHGGSGGYGNIEIGSSGSATITNSRIHDGSAAGITVLAGGALTSFAENSFADNAQGAVELPAGVLGALDSLSVYSGGTTGQFIDVFGGTVTTAQTWPKTDVPVQLNSNVYLEAAVTVQVGGWFEAGQYNRLVVQTGGSLTAVGTAADPIRFVGIQDSPGYWDGIEIATVDANNTLHYVEVANGGSGGYSNVYVTSSGQVELANSTFRAASTHGVYVESGGELVNFSSNSFTNNQGAALKVPAEELGALDAASTYAGGNAADYIATHGGTVSSTQTWPSTDAPIRFDSNTYIEAAVTIAAGADLRFAQYERLVVQGTNGELTAVGTSTDSITILGLQSSKGYWDGVEVATTNANTFDYVDIGFGGSGGWANIYITSSGAATVSNSYIHDSSGFGIETETGGTFNDGGGNTYSGNTDGPTG